MKKTVLFIAILALLCASLVSCNFLGNLFGWKTPGGTETPGDGDNNAQDNLIYNSETTLYFVYDPLKLSSEDIDKITEAFANKGVMILPHGKDNAPQEHELVIGNVGREVSNMAYSHLERIDLMKEADARYCFYSDGSSLAMAYDEDYEGYCFDAAVDTLISEYADNELTLSKGAYNKTCFNIYDYLEEVDAVYYKDGWTKIAAEAGQYGSSLVSALQALYSIYDGEKITSWLANLYDTNICVCVGYDREEECKNSKWCGTGGFYYSNSARDNYNFLPDAESTVQALGFLTDSGISAGLGGYAQVVPEWMGEQITDFIYNLQDPDGYFYHPQWGKSIGDSRKGRDLNWCRNILNAFGVKPKYAIIGDVVVDEVSAKLPQRLGMSSVAAVSKVVLADGAVIPDHLKTLDAFKEYVYDLDVENNSYAAGNTFSAQLSQIKTRPAEFGEFLISHLNEVYNKHNNGTWHHTINYKAVNGVMKISGVYSGLGAAIPNAALACKAAFAAVSSDETTGGIVDIWNTWEAVVRVLNNITDYSDGGEAEAELLRAEIIADAPDAIRASMMKLTEYLKDDGSFSYTKTASSATSQGMPVALPGTNEGDVNATVIGSTYMISSIFQSLGMSDSLVTLCRTRERAIFYNIINDLPPVNKGGSVNIEVEPIDFEYDEVGDISSEVTIGSGASGIVEADPRGEGNVLNYTSRVNAGSENKYNQNFLSINNMGIGNRVQIFEGELCFKEAIPTNDAFRIELGRDGDVYNCYRIVFKVKGDTMELWESSSATPSCAVNNYLGVSVKRGEWFKLRIEYYKGDHYTVRAKVYFNDKLLAVSDNYYDQTGKKLNDEGVPQTTFSQTRFYSLNNTRVVVLLDNLLSYVSNDSYVAEELHEDYRSNPLSINVDKKYDKTPVYDFETIPEGEKYPENLLVNSYGGTEIIKKGGNSLLSISGTSNVQVPTATLTADANCSVFGIKIDASSSKTGNIAKISLAEISYTDKSIMDLTVAVVSEGSEKYVVLKGSDGKEIAGVKYPASELSELRIDYYEKEKTALIYVNGDITGFSTLVNAGTDNVKYGKAIVSVLGDGALVIDDLYAERSTKDYIAATTPKNDEKIYDFASGLDGVELSGGVTLSSGKLSFDTSKEGYAKIPAYNRDIVVSMSAFTFDIRYSTLSTNDVTHEILLTDEAGKTVVSFVLYSDGTDIKLYEKSALGIHAQPILSFKGTSGANLRFEYYEVDGIAKIFVDGVYRAETNIVYSKANYRLPPSYLVIKSVGAKPSVSSIDNIGINRSNKLYTASATTKPESDSPVISFEYATLGSFSGDISYKINSTAPDPHVVEQYLNGPNKALKFETSKGTSMDILTISNTLKVSGAKSNIFETALLVESGEAVPFQVWFWSGDECGIQLNIKIDGSSILFYHGNDQKTAVDTGVNLGTWINLRVETYFVGNELIAKVTVNNALLYTVKYFSTDDGVYAQITKADGSILDAIMTTNGEQTVGGVSKVEFRALKDAVATVYLDNVMLSESTNTYQP